MPLKVCKGKFQQTEDETGIMEKHVQFIAMAPQKARLQRDVVPGMTQEAIAFLPYTVSPPQAGSRGRKLNIKRLLRFRP